MDKSNFIYSILKDRNIISFNSKLIILLVFWGCFGTLPLMLIFALKFWWNFLWSLTIIFGPILIFSFIWYILYQISILPFKIMEDLWKVGRKLDWLKQFELQKISDFQEIYNHTKEVYKINKKLLFYKKTFWLFLTQETISSLEEFFFRTTHNTLCTILNLRSDLATHLTEQQKILKWAKSEVEKNITGTPELVAVSAEQKLRLDRQIEQFEELQRVLVRV